MEITDILFQPVDLEAFNFQALADFFDFDALTQFLSADANYRAFKSFVDRLENSLLLAVHTLMATVTHLLYFFRVGPVKYLNEHRQQFCRAQPSYGSDAFLQLLDHAPLSIVYCSQWFNNGLLAVEKLWIAPYVIFQFLTDKFTRFIGERFATRQSESAVTF